LDFVGGSEDYGQGILSKANRSKEKRQLGIALGSPINNENPIKCEAGASHLISEVPKQSFGTSFTESICSAVVMMTH
jgi:hypothetical protein